MRHWLLSIALLASRSPSFAYDPVRARDNFAHEAIECSAYFMLASAVPSLDAQTVKALRDRFSVLFDLSVSLTSEELTKARFQLAEKGMFRDLNGSWSNLAIVSNKYAYPCTDLVKDPQTRLKYWMDKKD